MESKYELYKVQPFSSVKQLISLAETESGEKIAFRYKTGDGVCDVTYSEFADDIRFLGTGLLSLGVGKTHIACIGENSFKWVTAYLTVLCSDSVFCPVDKELPYSGIRTVINSGDSEIVFYAKKFEQTFRDNRADFPNVKFFIGFDREEDDGEFLSYDRLLEKGRSLYSGGNHAYDALRSDPDELKMLVFTSGTTGLAKGVMLTEHNLVSGVYYGLQVSTVYDCCLSVLPYHHTYESVCGLLVSLHKRATICINDSMSAVLRNLQLYKPSYIYLVPAFAEVFYKKIWENAESTGKAAALKALIATSNGLRKVGVDKRSTFFRTIHETFGGRLVKIVCGGAPIRAEVGQFFEAIGIPLINGYGITECSPLVSANREDFNDPSTVGVLLPCLELKFDDVDADGVGEICVKGDVVMKGYYKNPEATAAAIVDGWFHTGDFGKTDEYGRLIVTGRKKNIIVLSNGKNVYPEEIEEYIQSIPYVKEVVVYGLKNASGGDRALAAEIFLDSDAVERMKIRDPEERIVKDVRKATSELPSYKRIVQINLRTEQFEKTTTNKIIRTSHS